MAAVFFQLATSRRENSAFSLRALALSGFILAPFCLSERLHKNRIQALRVKERATLLKGEKTGATNEFAKQP